VSVSHEDAEAHTVVLERARRRALTVVLVDCIAIVILVLVRAQNAEVLTFGATEESIFSFGILAIAIHSGFRWGQFEKLGAVLRALRDLEERATPSGTEPGL